MPDDSRLGRFACPDCFTRMTPVRNRRRKRGEVKGVRSAEVKKPGRATGGRLAEIEAVLRAEITPETQGPQEAMERMRALHPKLNIEAITEAQR
jgi:hypothetical protein